jgi:uridine monophosphate synthetase
MRELIEHLMDAGCVKFGRFTLKSGLESPIYIDLRLVVSDAALLRRVAQALAERARPLAFDRIAAIPYAGLPIGVALGLEMERPVIYPRREAKSYGTQRAIEGAYRAGERALVVDDLITRGDSKLEAIAPLEAAGLSVGDVLVLIDREQGGGADLARRGYTLHSVLRLSEVVDALHDRGRISPERHAEVMAYLRRG